jgi:hypothetical protein
MTAIDPSDARSYPELFIFRSRDGMATDCQS